MKHPVQLGAEAGSPHWLRQSSLGPSELGHPEPQGWEQTPPLRGHFTQKATAQRPGYRPQLQAPRTERLPWGCSRGLKATLGGLQSSKISPDWQGADTDSGSNMQWGKLCFISRPWVQSACSPWLFYLKRTVRLRGGTISSWTLRSVQTKRRPRPRVAGEHWFSYRQGTGGPSRPRAREAERAQDPDHPLWAHGILGTLSVAPPEASPTPAAPLRLCGHAWALGAQAQPDEGPRTSRLHGEDRASESRRPQLGLPKACVLSLWKQLLQELLPPLETARLPPLPCVCWAGGLCCGLD